MTDKIQITITRNCDADGKGGEVVEDASAILGNIPGDGSLLDVIVAAFADQYPIPTISAENQEDPPRLSMTPYRNLSYRIRLFVYDVVDGWRHKKAIETMAAEKAAEDAAIASSYKVSE